MPLPETISGPVLFSLDFLIPELAFKQPLKNLQQPSDLLECQEHPGAGRYTWYGLGGFNSRPNLTNSQFVCGENDLHLQHNYHNHTSWLSTNFQIKSSNCSTFESGVLVVSKRIFSRQPFAGLRVLRAASPQD